MPPKKTRAHSSLDAARRVLKDQSILDVDGRVRLDLGRAERTGIPEVIIAEGKRPADLRRAVEGFLSAHGRAIVTRCPGGVRWPGIDAKIEEYPDCGIVILRRGRAPKRTGGRVAVLTGGASDARIAEEATIIAQELGCEVRREEDVGVASLGRVLQALERLAPWDPHAYIVCAGREGALAPVVAGLVQGPIIGVPVSTGYGRGGKGEAALLTMLQSCSPLVTVNIDAGFVAGGVAAQIANRIARAEKT